MKLPTRFLFKFRLVSAFLGALAASLPTDERHDTTLGHSPTPAYLEPGLEKRISWSILFSMMGYGYGSSSSSWRQESGGDVAIHCRVGDALLLAGPVTVIIGFAQL